ncbi:MAG: hypothetical protein F9K15_02415 [Zoogloea sp.]|nr:MAG: hypothetical protein F9K15_02415 [Zoogloea sp.]
MVELKMSPDEFWALSYYELCCIYLHLNPPINTNDGPLFNEQEKASIQKIIEYNKKRRGQEG